jgi:hypothetical protein
MEMDSDRPAADAWKPPRTGSADAADRDEGVSDAGLSEAKSNRPPEGSQPSDGRSNSTFREEHDAEAIENAAPSMAVEGSIPIAHQRLMLGRRFRDDVPGLVLLWCLWLLASWLMVRYQDGMSLKQMIGLSPEAPPVTAMDLRWMTLAAVLGLSSLWPAIRLSQPPTRGRVLDGLVQPLVDWLSLMIIWQAVLLPLYVPIYKPIYGIVPWPTTQLLWLDLAVASWALLMGLVIGWGRAGKSADRRTLAMLAGVVLLLAEPAVLAVIHGLGQVVTDQVMPLAWTPRLSPILMLWGLAAPPGHFELAPWRGQVLSILLAAGVGWAAWGLAVAGRHRFGKR